MQLHPKGRTPSMTRFLERTQMFFDTDTLFGKDKGINTGCDPKRNEKKKTYRPAAWLPEESMQSHGQSETRARGSCTLYNQKR